MDLVLQCFSVTGVFGKDVYNIYNNIHTIVKNIKRRATRSVSVPKSDPSSVVPASGLLAAVFHRQCRG